MQFQTFTREYVERLIDGDPETEQEKTEARLRKETGKGRTDQLSVEQRRQIADAKRRDEGK